MLGNPGGPSNFIDLFDVGVTSNLFSVSAALSLLDSRASSPNTSSLITPYIAAPQITIPAAESVIERLDLAKSCSLFARAAD